MLPKGQETHHDQTTNQPAQDIFTGVGAVCVCVTRLEYVVTNKPYRSFKQMQLS